MSDERCSQVIKEILFVDDEESLALLGADLLGDFGYRVTCAFDGEEALTLFRQKEPCFDIVITDVTMPKMNGLELAQEIFCISPDTPIILCSGHMLTMQEEGMEKTNIRAVQAKTTVCECLPRVIEEILSAG